MVAAVELLSVRDVRSKLYRFLFDWGNIQCEGFLPGQGDGIHSGNKPDSRLPLPGYFTDITLAFTALNTGTRGVERGWRIPHLAKHRFNRRQQVIWLYYVDGHGLVVVPKATERQLIAMAPRIPKEPKRHTAEGDERVGAVLGLSGKTVEEYRHGAISTMADHIRWSAVDIPGRLR